MERNRAISLPIVLMVLASVVMAACGSNSDKSSSGSPPVTSKNLGSTVRMMTEGPLTNPSGGLSHPEFKDTANATEAWINAHGGIDGHKLQIDFCDDQGNANVSQNCARQAKTNGDVAVVGAYPNLGADGQVMTILHEEGIANFGEFQPTTAVLEDTLGFNVSLGPAGLTGGAGLLAGKYCTGRIGLVVIAVPAQKQLTDVAEAGLKAAGKKPSVFVSLPQTVGDYSSEVAKATTNTKCVMLVASEAQSQVFEAAMVSAGANQQVYGIVGNAIVPKTISAFPDLLEGAMIASTVPAISSPELADFRKAVDQYGKAASLDPSNGLGDEGIWIAYQVLNKALTAKHPATLTASSVVKALQGTTHLATNGLTPDLNFACPAQLPGVGYGPVNSITAQTVTKGKIVNFQQGKFFSAAEIYGKGKARC